MSAGSFDNAPYPGPPVPANGPPSAEPPAESWWQRHGGKIMLAGLVLFIVAVLSCCIGGVLLVRVWLGAAPVYQQALAKATADPRVVEALGEPIQPAEQMRGHIPGLKDDDYLGLEIPINGPKGSAVIIVEATRLDDDDWRIDNLTVAPEGADAPIRIIPEQP